MKHHDYFYNCSREYLDRIDVRLFDEVSASIKALDKREIQAEINKDMLHELVKYGWSFDSVSHADKNLKDQNNRSLCLTSTTLNAGWHSDFAKEFDTKLVQLEVQFGKVESMFKDFCGFRIAYSEGRLALGIEVVMFDPGSYFAHRKAAISGMAYFDIAKRTLPAIGLDCPIWLVGIDV